jgi:hypothetical protein
MNIVPDGNILEAFENPGGMTWAKALGELIDNSFAAQAKLVQITCSGSRKRGSFIVIKDDGHGTSKMASFVTLGRHVEHRLDDLIGHFGIGLKAIALWMGKKHSTMTVSSVSDGIMRTLDVNWHETAMNGWVIRDPEERPAAPGESGTKITIQPVVPRFPAGKDFQSLLNGLGFQYFPALKAGAQISIKSQSNNNPSMVVPYWRMPPLEDGVIDQVITVGKWQHHVFAGVIAQGGDHVRHGVTYYRGCRVVAYPSGNGCGDYGPSGVCCLVKVDPHVRLTTLKTGVVDATALYAGVYAAILPILLRAQQRKSQLSSTAFMQQVSQHLDPLRRQVLARAKAKRRPGRGQAGTVTETGMGSPHTQAAIEQPGDRFAARRQAQGLAAPSKIAPGSVDYVYATLDDPNVMAHFTPPRTIVLNQRHSVVEHARTTGNSLATALIIGAHISIEDATAGQQLFKGLGLPDADHRERFVRRLGAVVECTETQLDGLAVGASSAEPPADSSEG